jgi:UDP-glucose 4-epimerase
MAYKKELFFPMSPGSLHAKVSASNRGVLVWGALGMIGYGLTAALLAAGFRVSVLCRARHLYAQPSWAAQVRWHELEVGCSDAVMDEAVASASVIVNLAGSSGAVASNTDPMHSLDSNCRVQLQFLQACQRAGHRPHVVFTSSRLVYGPVEQPMVSEDHPLSPRSMYAAHKACVENYLQVYASLDAITYTVCRISNAYGPESDWASKGYKILNSFVAKSLAGQPITLFGTGEQTRDFIYLDDLTEILMRCCVMHGVVNQVLNVGSGEGCRLVDAAGAINRLTGGPPLIFQPWPEEYLVVESGDYVSDIRKMCRLLEYRPQCRLEDGIVHTIRAYRSDQTIACPIAMPAVAIAG